MATICIVNGVEVPKKDLYKYEVQKEMVKRICAQKLRGDKGNADHKG